MGEDPVVRRVAVAVGHAHVVGRGAERGSRSVEAMGTYHDVAEFAAIGTGIHPQPAADGSRNADQEFQPGKTRLRGVARHLGVERAGTGKHRLAVMADSVHMRGRADHHPADAAVADKKVRSGADGEKRDVGRAGGKETAEIRGVGRAEDDVGRAADTEPGVAGHRHRRGIVAANLRQAVEKRAGHAPSSRSLSISAGSRAAHPVMSPAPRHITRSPGEVRARISGASAVSEASAAGPRCP